MQENGLVKSKNQLNNSYRAEEPPPDPRDFGTKEEEIKNRELLSHLYEQQKNRRALVEKYEREERIKKELEEEQKLKELMAKKAYFQRRNASAKHRAEVHNERIKQMLQKVDEYMRKISNLDSIEKIKEQAQKEMEEEIEKEKKKKRKLTKKEIDRMTKMNSIKEQLRKDNIKKIEERKQNEILKNKKLEKAEKANKRAENILKNGYKLPKAGDENLKDKNINLRSGGLGIFSEEKIEGTNLAHNIENEKQIKRPNSAFKISNKNYAKKINKEENITPEEKLKQILKKDPNNLKELLNFKKKYKYIEIGPYIHKAKMNQIKLNKNKHKNKLKRTELNNDNIDSSSDDEFNELNNKEDIKDEINDKEKKNKILFKEEIINEGDTAPNMVEHQDNKEENDDGNNITIEKEKNKSKSKEKKKMKKSKSKEKEKNKSKSKDKKEKIKKKKPDIKNNYIEACKYNNDECIKNILMNADSDEKIYSIVNSRDNFNRNGLMYLLIHNNLNMIKLNLLSGVKLDGTKDIYGRNLIHYCCTNFIEKSILDIICHCIDFKRFGDLCTYVNKCIPITKRLNDDIYSKEFQQECEKKIKDFDNIIMNKEEKNIHINDNEVSNIKKIVNSPDKDGNYPMHYLAKNNDMDKMEILIYYHAELDVLDSEGKKPIDLTSNNVIQQFLLKNEENSKSKKNVDNINNNITNSNNPLDLNKSNISLINLSSLNIEQIQYFTPEKINSYYSGVENNSLLMYSVINENYELFKFLITEKNAKVDYINGNGWTILHFIITKKLWIFFSFLFDLPNPENCITPETIYNELEQKNYKKIDLMGNNGNLTFLGQAIKIVDNLTNKNENILSLCVEEFNEDIFIIKIFLILYDNYIKYFAMKEPKNIIFQRQYGKYDESSYLNIIFNRQYGKNKETILIKYVKKNNLNAIKYLLNDLCRKKNILNLNIYQGDYNNQNILHHAVNLKHKEIIKYLVKYDCDYNLLKTNKDRKGKTPIDLDRTKTFQFEYITIWDAAKNNDVNMLNKLIKDLKYYTVNETTYIYKNTPLHYAVKNKSERAILYLLKEGADKDKKNSSGQTPLDTIEKIKFSDKKWIKIVKAIFSGKIKEFTDLDKLDVDKFMKNGDEEGYKTDKNKKREKTLNKDNIISESFGDNFVTNMRLINLMTSIKKIVKNNKIEIKKIFEKYDKKEKGVLSVKEFIQVFKELGLQEETEKEKDDIDYLLICLDTNKDGELHYKDFESMLE